MLLGDLLDARGSTAVAAVVAAVTTPTAGAGTGTGVAGAARRYDGLSDFLAFE